MDNLMPTGHYRPTCSGFTGLSSHRFGLDRCEVGAMAEDFATVPPGCKKIQGETFLKFICLYVFVTVSVYMACTFCESTTCQGSAWRKWITMEIQAAHLGCTKRH